MQNLPQKCPNYDQFPLKAANSAWSSNLAVTTTPRLESFKQDLIFLRKMGILAIGKLIPMMTKLARGPAPMISPPQSEQEASVKSYGNAIL